MLEWLAGLDLFRMYYGFGLSLHGHAVIRTRMFLARILRVAMRKLPGFYGETVTKLQLHHNLECVDHFKMWKINKNGRTCKNGQSLRSDFRMSIIGNIILRGVNRFGYW